MTTFTTALNQVSSLYVGYFGRAGDPSGENYWIGQLNAKTITLSQMAASFATQPEATAKYPYLANPNLSDPGAFVDQVYLNLFNHVADVTGKAYWVAQLQAAGGSASAVGQFILNVISGAVAVDDTTITNKVDVASDFTVKATNAGTTWNASAAAQSSIEIAATNETAASVTAAKAATDAYIASAPGPQSNFTLAIDTLTASGQNANFNAPLVFNAPSGAVIQSLQSGDSATDTAPPTGTGLSNGGTFTATLNAAAVPLVTLKGIPTHTVTALAASGYSGDITGLVTFNNLQSAAGITIGTLGSGIDKGGVAGTTTTGATLLSTVNLNNVTGTAGTTIFVNTAALAGAADSLNINAIGPLGTGTALGGASTVSVKNDTAALGVAMNGYETINLNATAATNIALADAASGIASTTRINLSGAGLITLWSQASEAHFTKLTTIDASTQTGGVTVNGGVAGTGVTVGAVITSFKGGTGADSLDISTMTAAQVQAITLGNLDGGTGTARDTLILGSNAGGTGAANSLVALNNSNFETIGVSTLGGTIDFSKYGAVDSLTLVNGQAAAAIFNNMGSGLTVNLGANEGASTLAFNASGLGLADAVSVTFTAAAAQGAHTVTGFETITDTIANASRAGGAWAGLTATASAGGLVTHNIVDNFTGTGGTFTITTENVGSGVVAITGTGTASLTIGTTTAGTVDASGLNTGAADATAGLIMTNMSAGTGSMSILGSNGADRLRGSAQADIVNGGAGNDTIDGAPGGDVMTGGMGVDIYGLANNFATGGQGVAPSATTFTTVAAGQTITFDQNAVGVSNVDRVTDFLSGTDGMDTLGGILATSLVGVNAATTGSVGTTYVVYGTYVAATGIFTAAAGFVGGVSTDALLTTSDGATNLNATGGAGNNSWVLLTGLNQALVAADFL